MNFNSPIFLFIFLPIFFIVYYLIPGRGKFLVGIVGSLVFYAWGDLVYIPFVIGFVVFSYLFGIGIGRWKGHKFAWLFLWTGIFINIFLLVVFKLWKTANYPFGLSYLTFQVIAYFIEIYTGKLDTEKNFINFSFYLLLFPKIPVGPIVRYSSFRDQMQDFRVEPTNAANGMRRFIIGLAKKVLVADTLARVVTPIFSLSSPTISPTVAWLVIISYSLQLYYDFSGFTDMSIGLGGMMGFRFVENFNFPFISKNIGEFWRRWHISLSSWFRDFVFFPLERRRFFSMGQSVNILIVFLLTGLWHGITINFIVWGLIHGFALVFESSSLGRRFRAVWIPIQHLYALGIILLGWVFFRSPTLDFAVAFLRRLLGDVAGLKGLPFELTSPLPFIEPTFVVALTTGLIFVFPMNHWFEGLYKKFAADGPLTRSVMRLAGDLLLTFILIFSIVAMASSAFTPGIYEVF